jgi:hypothetical protein
MPEQQIRPSSVTGRATCPECGASVPVVGGRWLYVHREGSAEYAYPRGNRAARCPGSLFPVDPRTTGDTGLTGTAGPEGPTDADRRGQVAGG